VDGGAFVVAGTVGDNVTTFEDTDVPRGHTYEYRVKATNAAGDSEYSGIAMKAT
jgi:hypothetical protein